MKLIKFSLIAITLLTSSAEKTSGTEVSLRREFRGCLHIYSHAPACERMEYSVSYSA